MRRSIKYIKYLLFILFTLLAACGEGGYSTPEPQGCKPIESSRGNLVSASSTTTYTLADVQNISVNVFTGLFSDHLDQMKTGVSAHKIIYRTVNPAGNSITASGILLLPETSSAETTAIVSYQHGTIFGDSRAPTNGLFHKYLGAVIASMDHIVVIPDYIGYGESVTELHPYMHAESLADSTIDLIKAVKTHLASEGIATSGQLFLGGFSEGAYAAVATHKMIQECYTVELSVTATSAGAGSYDLATTSRTLLDLDTLPSGAYVAFVYKAYDTIYSFNRISEVFNEPYATLVNTHFDGAHDDPIVDAAITKVTSSLFKEPFLSNFRGNGETAIKQRLAENNVYDWKPTSPIRFFHGQDDIISPYANSVTAVDTMQAYGATGIELTKCSASPPTHLTCRYPYFEDMLGYFLSK